MRQVFKNMDKDGSGTVSKDEFLKICKNLSKEQVTTFFMSLNIAHTVYGE